MNQITYQQNYAALRFVLSHSLSLYRSFLRWHCQSNPLILFLFSFAHAFPLPAARRELSRWRKSEPFARSQYPGPRFEELAPFCFPPAGPLCGRNGWIFHRSYESNLASGMMMSPGAFSRMVKGLPENCLQTRTRTKDVRQRWKVKAQAFFPFLNPLSVEPKKGRVLQNLVH